MAGGAGRFAHEPRANAPAADSGVAAQRLDSLGPMPEWNLADLYPGTTSAALQRDIEQAVKAAAAFKSRYQGKLAALAEDGAALSACVRDYEALEDLLGRLASYAQLLYAGNTADQTNRKFYGDMQERLTNITSDLIFFSLEFNSLDDVPLAKACRHPGLAKYKPWIDDLRKEKPYQLDEKTEQLFHEKSVTGRAAWNRLFNETMTGLRFHIGGADLAIEPALSLLSDPDEGKRRDAAAGLGKVFEQKADLFALITNTLAKDKEISDRWRGFKDVADGRHLANRVEREVVDALVEAVRASYPRLSHRYYAMKAKWLGKPKLEHWDRNAPLPDKPDRTIGWTAARDTVLGAYAGFSPEMARIAGAFFEKGWIDAPVRDGKSPGAFAHPTVPSAHPYILLNYQGKPRDVMTLAHELGHGVHQVLANAQGPLMAPTPLTLAETASVFGEMLTFKALLADAKSPKERKAMIASKVEDMINTVVRQIAFYTFERKVHTERKAGELTAQRLCEIWLEVQYESLGPAVNVEQNYKAFWCYIPHFIHSPFYVYAYAFGDCLVNSLYARYEQADEPAQGGGFVDKYFAMLRAGGTKHHSELLAPFGLDASKPEFWHMGLKVIEGMIDELERLDEAA
jgi:oligoendopeptidase F